ncbi:uncharacterized protein LOC100114498 [Nasonia vitripennis]|uniref:Uncharacterized protein n=1 Tax=Nasonia vitripennis TaxID=7425 RepID=A0A7M7Q5Q5_NASVI|nr:uncharacterized protein LOC100114498 [Nasonia vitripennis]XP_031782282.1 uncharacterized protein LOC100114498 [Nasonia vitripennis]
MLRALILIAAAAACSAAPQFLIRNSAPLPHPAVLENDAMEALLPEHLKNDFYKNPHIVAALAEPSWFGHKEAQVTNRETDMIPREKVFHILHNAGFIRR